MKIRLGFPTFLLVLIFPFFFFGGPGQYAARSFRSSWDLGHILFFTLVSVRLCDFYSGRASLLKPVQLFLRVFLIVFVLGLMIEFLQLFAHGRSPDIFDISRNQLGALLGFVFFCPVRNKLSPIVLLSIQAGTLLVVLGILLPLARAVIDERIANIQFPLLSDFETPFEIYRWQDVYQLQRVDNPVRHGKKSVRIQLSTEEYSGISLINFSHDWSRYQWLNFSVFNPTDAELPLQSRIHDRLHGEHDQGYRDRFNQQFILHSGWNDLHISLDEVQTAPTGREMDMQKIEGFAIFVIRQARPLVLYLDNIYLSK